MLKNKIIGRQPTEHGEYMPGQAYGKKFIVTLFDCGWESKHDNNTSAPATLNAQTGTITENTTDWKKKWGSYKQWLIDNGYQKMDANNVKDGNNNQHQINDSFANEIGSDSTPESIKGRISNLEEAVGSGGSVDERIAEEGARHYLKSETYTKEEVNGMITTPNQEYVSVEATEQTTAATDVLPATGAADTIYRVANWDGSQYDASVYSEYAWNGTQYIHLSTKTQIGEVFDISAYHATGGTLATYTDLADALTGTNGGVPQLLQKGGMSIKFVQTSDNKYVQYRLMSSSFSTTVSDWQGVDEEPIAGSNNLVKSGGVAEEISQLGQYKEDNPEWIKVVIDSNDRILYGVKTDGKFYFGDGCPPQVQEYVQQQIDEYGVSVDTLLAKKVDKVAGKGLSSNDFSNSEKEVVDMNTLSENPEWLKVTTDSDGKILEGIRTNGEKEVFVNTRMPSVTLPKEGITDLQKQLDSAQEYDVAVGNKRAFGTYKSELDASPLNNNPDDYYVAYKSSEKRPLKKAIRRGIVAINHDDLPASDYIGNRKIYNKYGFNANFNFTLNPFTSKEQKERMQDNVAKMVKDGNTIGLHAILGASYFFLNPEFDVRPDGSNTFAPILSQIQGDQEDKTGTNAFGKTIGATTKMSEIGYDVYPSDLKSILVVNLTSAQLNSLNGCYTHYADAQPITGLDLDGNSATKTRIQWLEYWYNKLIDSTLGYSSTESALADRFAEDYEIPSGGTLADYYPDATHLKNGKMVFFDDTTNPHYSDSSYQKVGRFKKGLFKGCASCCNYEAIDYCIDVATAFINHYFGIPSFAHFNRHGVYFYGPYITDQEAGLRYHDVAEYFIFAIQDNIYRSRIGAFVNTADILLSRGIKSYYENKFVVALTAQKLLYDGCKGKLPEYFNGDCFQNYLSMIGTDSSQAISISDFNTFMAGVDNWLHFLYENAGKTLTRNGVTLKVFTLVRECIMKIISSIGTGFIPVLGFDTIHANPSESMALDLLLRFCYLNDIDVVPLEEARRIAHYSENSVKDNYFPNPHFNQSILRTIGNVSLAIPDGWDFSYSVGEPSIVVDDTYKDLELTTDANEELEIFTRIYNLPAGNYTLKMNIKSEGSYFVKVFKQLVGSPVQLSSDTQIGRLYGGSSFTEQTLDFTIPEYHQNQNNPTNAVNQICSGYEDNLAYIHIDLYCANGGYVWIKDCEIIKNV